MYRSTNYPFQSFKSTISKKKEKHNKINNLILENFTLFDDFINAETVWLSMKEKGIELSISSFYTRLKELVGASLMEKKNNGYNKFVYKKVATKL